MTRHYELDANGWPTASFAREQPNRNTQLLPDKPSEFHRWDGTQWVEDSVEALAARKDIMREQADAEYQASLKRGFSYDGGTFPATGPKRARVVELVAGINAGKGLPQDKTAVRFRDLSDTAHDLSETGVIELGAAGSDLVDAADDRLEELYASIDAASSNADLDAIDVTSGWPN